MVTTGRLEILNAAVAVVREDGVHIRLIEPSAFVEVPQDVERSRLELIVDLAMGFAPAVLILATRHWLEVERVRNHAMDVQIAVFGPVMLKFNAEVNAVI